MVTIQFRNREEYVRSTIQICLTYHTRTLTLRLDGSVNVPIPFVLMISRTSVVIPSRYPIRIFSSCLWSMGISQH